MLIAVNVAHGIHSLTRPPFLLAIGVLILAGLAVSQGNLRTVARHTMVFGWSGYALTTASTEFPSVLHIVTLMAAGAGAGLDLMLRPPRERHPYDTAVPWPSRFLFVYLGFALLGCIASPFGPKNMFHWFEGVIMVTTALYGVASGLGVRLLMGTAGAAFVNVLLNSHKTNYVDGVKRLGFYMQSNHLAFAACIAILAIVWLYQTYHRFKPLLIACGVVSAYVLYGSKSRTALLGMVAAMAVAGLTSLPAGRRARILIWVGAAIIFAGPILLPVVVPWLNRGSSNSVTTLTGRTDFWPLAVNMIEHRPVIGWGVNAVTSPAGYKFQEVTAGAIQAHNAFLESGLIGGLPGMLFWAGSLFGTLIGSLRLPRGPTRFFLCSATILLAFDSLTESNPAWYGDMFIVFLICLGTYSQLRRALVLESAGSHVAGYAKVTFRSTPARTLAARLTTTRTVWTAQNQGVSWSVRSSHPVPVTAGGQSVTRRPRPVLEPRRMRRSIRPSPPSPRALMRK